MPSRRSIRSCALLLPLAAALGCTTTVDLEIDDNDQFSPGGRISYEIWPGNDTRRSGSLLDLVWPSSSTDPTQAVTVRNSRIRPTISIDGQIASVEGRDGQNLALGEEVDVGVSIVGPAQLDLDADNLRGHLAARGGVRFYDVLSIEAITGIGVDSTEVKVRGGGFSVTEDQINPGWLIGARATVRPIALFDLYAQYLVNFADTWEGIHDTELGVELNLTRNIGLFAGYRWWKYEDEQWFDTDWELDISGPTAGASLKF